MKKHEYEALKKAEQEVGAVPHGADTRRAMREYEQRDRAVREFVAYVYPGSDTIKAHSLLRVACGLEDPK